VVAVQSLTLTGQFRVRSVSHDGDTHGTDWTTTVELAP
jgi:hypothetical protein